MAVTGKIYPLGIVRAYAGDINADSDTIKCALLTSSYSPNLQGHQTWADSTVYGKEVSGTGYVAGGKTLTGVTLGLKAGTAIMQFWTNDCEWASSTITARYAVIYDATTNYLICYIDFGENKSSVNGLFKLDFSATEGTFQIENV